MTDTSLRTWREIALGFLKVGATAYGGPAIMGVKQAEFQEKRQWVSKPRFLEGLALVNVLPGATATQLGIFLGYERGRRTLDRINIARRSGRVPRRTT